MHFDPKTRRYVDESGHALTPAQVRAHIEEFISSEQSEVKSQAEKLLAGSISVASFFQFMRFKITAWHSISGTIAYGGVSQMTPERWKRINEKILSELTYLNEFEAQTEQSFLAAQQIAQGVVQAIADKIPQGLETVVEQRVSEALLDAAPSDVESVVRGAITDALADSVEDAGRIAKGVSIAATVAAVLIGGTIGNRSQLYADSIWATHENNVLERERDEGVTLGRRICLDDPASCEECPDAASEEFIPLDEIAPIGSLACFSNCRCEIEYDVSGAQFKTSELFQGVVRGQDAFGGDAEVS